MLSISHTTSNYMNIVCPLCTYRSNNYNNNKSNIININKRNSIFVMHSKALYDHMFQRGLLLGNLTTSKLLMGNLGTRKCWPLTLPEGLSR